MDFNLAPDRLYGTHGTIQKNWESYGGQPVVLGSGGGCRGPPAGKNGKFQLILFANGSNTNGTNWDFPFFQTVGLLRALVGGFFGVALGGTGGVEIRTAFLKN